MRLFSIVRRHRRAILAAALVAAGGTLPAPAFADGFQTHWCRGYASQAVDAAKRNFYSNCGGTGDRWGMDYRGHLNWCANLPDEEGTGEYMSVAGGETRARRNLLRQCNAASMAPPPLVDPRDEPAPSNTRPDPGQDCGSGWYLGSDGTCYPKLG